MPPYSPAFHSRQRDAPHRRLQGGDPAAVGRIAQRAADVVAETEGRHARGKRRRLAATRSRPASGGRSRGCACGRAAGCRYPDVRPSLAGSCGRAESPLPASCARRSPHRARAKVFANAGTRWVVGEPTQSMFSLMVNGTPCSGAGPLRERDRVRGIGGGEGGVVEPVDHGVDERG